MTEDQATPENFTKADFEKYVLDVLKKGREIGEIYVKLFTGTGDSKALIAEIEEKIEGIKTEYQSLFLIDPTTNSTKIQGLNDQIREIRAYHKELLIGEETNKSIKKEIEEVKDDIEDSQSKIIDFYNELFDDESTSEGGKKKQIDTAISTILNFHKELTKVGGYQVATEEAYAKIIDLYDDLFSLTDDATKQNKVDRLQEEIVNINSFNKVLETEIKVFIKDTQSDITRKQEDVSRLLGSALGPALVQGYLDSKNEYRRIPHYVEIKNKSFFSDEYWLGLVKNTYMTLASLSGLFIDYVFFVLPLLLSVMILTQQIGIIDQFKIPFNEDLFKQINVFDRLLISLPLWWISLFGYKNIRDKNRLAEEYNHKAQVVNMYNKFSSEEKTYPIESQIKIKLQEELIDVISRNPSEIYGRDETIFDKISKIVLAIKGVYEPQEKVSQNPVISTVDVKPVVKPATPSTSKPT